MKFTIARRLMSLVAAVAAPALVAVQPAWAGGTTQTVTYTVGTPGTEYYAQFSWTVTNVTAKGTFVDGSPWVKVDPGSQLISLSPTSQRRATSTGFLVTINGSAKNPKMRSYYNPDTLDGFVAGKQLFDSRRIFIAGLFRVARVSPAQGLRAANAGVRSPGRRFGARGAQRGEPSLSPYWRS